MKDLFLSDIRDKLCECLFGVNNFNETTQYEISELIKNEDVTLKEIVDVAIKTVLKEFPKIKLH
jgi:hypothetical protein